MRSGKKIDLVRPFGMSEDVLFETLFGRKPASWDRKLIDSRLQGSVVMVTGAAGSIGSELCRQIASSQPAAVIGFDHAETPLFLLEQSLKRAFPGLAFYPELGDINRASDVDRAMRHRPSIVYHAAAYKHVSMMERNAVAAVETNILGTCVVAHAAADFDVETFVLVSTDKAVNPSSVMGATKRASELLIGTLQRRLNTKFVAVRFGNVLGSNGSVVPIFCGQIATGGPVTVTHAEMQRYFMTGSEAAQLVLQASVLGSGGEMFVLDMGSPASILKLAQDLIQLAGTSSTREIEIQFLGIRSGEKIVEELKLDSEQLNPTQHPGIGSLSCLEQVDADQVDASIAKLRQAVSANDHLRTIGLLRTLVPEFKPSQELEMSMGSHPITPLHPRLTHVPNCGNRRMRLVERREETQQGSECTMGAEISQ